MSSDIIKKYSTENLSENEKIFARQYFSYMEREFNRLNMNRAKEILDGFFYDTIKILKTSDENIGDKSPILVCLVKNELRRMKKFFTHYRKIGVERFAIIDNDSEDGTREFCLEQKDADVFLITQPFSSSRHVSWVNKVLCHYGYNRWYLSVDVDEFLDYIGSESMEIQSVVRFAEKNSLHRILAAQVDFYSERNLFAFPNDELPWDALKYFDADSYKIKDSQFYSLMVGGPRKRVLNTYSVLSKYPLFYLRPIDILTSMHYFYPYDDNFKSPYLMILKHYEFINGADKRKMKRIIRKENYASKSKEYKLMWQAFQNLDEVTFLYERSVAYNSSQDLKALAFLSSIKG